MTYDSAEVRGIAETAIRAAAQTKDNPADLLNVALEELVRKGRELPGYTTLDKMVAKIRTEVNGKVFTAVAARITPAQRTRLTELLRVDPSSRRSEFDRLKAPAKAASIGKFKLRLAHLAALDALGPTEAWLEGVPPGKISHFAGEARVTDVADFNRIGEDKRLTLLASLIHVLRTSARDEVTEMFCKRMAVIHKKGRARLEALREEYRVESERLLEVFGEVLAAAREASEPSEDAAGPTAGDDDVAARPDAAPGDGAGADEAGRDADAETARRTGLLVLKALAEGGGVERLSAAHEAVAAHHGNNYLPLLEACYKSHRPVLFTLVDAIELEAASAERAVLDALEFVRANRDRRGGLDRGVHRPRARREEGHRRRGHRRLRRSPVAQDAAGQAAAWDAGPAPLGGVRVLPPGRGAAFRRHRRGRLGLLRQPACAADGLGAARAPGRGFLRAGRDPRRR